MAARTSFFFFFLQMVAALSLLVSVAVASRSMKPAPTGPECDAVYAVKTGDTCFAITQAFKLGASFFAGINPNLDCDALFVGQWLCVSGTAN